MSQEHNFPFAVRTLANDKVKLVPFNVCLPRVVRCQSSYTSWVLTDGA